MNKLSVVKQANARKTDPEKLISAVKKHPAVWDACCPEYKIKTSKEAAWNEIATAVVDGWKDFKRSERQITLRFLIKRWNNIRDYYVKSLKLRRRKTHALADQLAFLRPQLQRKIDFQLSLTSQSNQFKIETIDDDEDFAEKSEEEFEELEELEEEEVQEDYVTFVDSFENNYEESTSTRSHRRQDTLQYDEEPDREEDPDLMFLKSLLPDMKKLAGEEKFMFKYAIMQAYMDILKKRTS